MISKKIRKKINHLLMVCMEASTTKADVFFQFVPMMSYISVSIYKNGWGFDCDESREKIIFIKEDTEDIAVKEIDNLIKIVNDLYVENVLEDGGA